jgi:3-hydroxyacyl-[acyl-carrier-protein] dehydratase
VVISLFKQDPAAYLPHRYPFLMLDRVIDHKPGQSAKARYRTSASLRGFPQILLVESVAQLAGIAAVENEGEGGFLATVDQAVFGRPPLLGETMEVTATIIKSFGRLCMVQGTVEADGEQLLDVRLTLGIGPL